MYKSKYVVNDHTLKKLRSKYIIVYRRTSKVKVVIIDKSVNIQTFA
jgi:hypothetical protein